jgi:Ni,Fe-hydrogenase III large subunit
VTAIEHIALDAWGETLARALRDGERFGGAWASERDGGLAWRALLISQHSHRVIFCQASKGQAESVVALTQAAGWDEREAHDLYGLRFSGHAPLRALVAHPDDPGLWMTPVTGEGVHQVAVGPIHAGVIESGHFRFHVIGERILAVDTRLFYKHRGLERAAEGHDSERALLYAQRACAACAVANTIAYAHAVEDARGLRPDRELRICRTVLLELERLYNHVHDIGAICAGVGFAPGSMAFAALKDRAQQINQRAFGHRFLFGSVRVGRGAVELNAARTDAALGALRELRADTAAAWRELEFAGSVQARLDGVGVLAHADAQRLGAVGPATRAAGIREDVRTSSPRLAYDGFTPAYSTAASGDVAARVRMRAIELETTYEILEDLLKQPLAPGTTTGDGTSGALGVGTVESPRGATICAVELDGTRVSRLHLRTSSYANWPALAHAAAGNLLADFPLINKSFELCYACVDR